MDQDQTALGLISAHTICLCLAFYKYVWHRDAAEDILDALF